MFNKQFFLNNCERSRQVANYPHFTYLTKDNNEKFLNEFLEWMEEEGITIECNTSYVEPEEIEGPYQVIDTGARIDVTKGRIPDKDIQKINKRLATIFKNEYGSHIKLLNIGVHLVPFSDKKRPNAIITFSKY